jgi:hypothetical protein
VSDEPVRWWEAETLDRERWGALVEPALVRLLQARDRDRMPHAVLLIGPAGLGRELAAVEASILLVCEGTTAPWSEGSCADRIRGGRHPDVEAVLPTGAKKIITIPQIREIVKTAQGRPYEGRRRVWILDGVEAGRFGASAANAFLKTLEEPPSHAVFILLAANPAAVLPTIRSRCQQLTLPGTVAVAKQLAEQSPLPELIESLADSDRAADIVRVVRRAIGGGLDGETRHLLRLPYVLPHEVPPFAVVAAVVAEMAGTTEDDPPGEELARLAVDLLATERCTSALNLNSRAQMVSCLMRWYRELGA